MLNLFRWQSVDTMRNRFRFYSLSVGMDLWGEPVLINHWGRIGTRGQRQFIWGPVSELGKRIERVKIERELHGYQVLSSFYKT
ncbi:WGR domain-containing protein [Candidatus Acetothermia bacterium]|nr:WGR domain-containing protein [Candidatus Acetothermia bacterium]